MILSLQTTTFGAYGGIQTYNRLVCRVLNEFRVAKEKQVSIMTDTAADLSGRHSELPNLSLAGFSHKRNAFLRHVVRIGLSQRIDLTLIGHINYAPLGLLLKRLQPQMRFGVMLYGIEAWQKLRGLRRQSLHAADFLISISEYTKQRVLANNSISASSFHLLPNALEWTDVESADWRETLPTRTRLLSVCRLDASERYKGVDKVIEVLPEIAKRVPDVEYLVIGGGTDLDRHKELARRFGVAERVHFLGLVTDDTLRACYRDSTLFVLPSESEGFGFVYLEAMKYAKAIVAANSGGAPEVVDDQVTGILVNYGEKEQLTEVLTALCLDSDKRKRLGQAGYARLQQKFTFPEFQRKLEEILLEEMPAAAQYRSRREVLNAA